MIRDHDATAARPGLPWRLLRAALLVSCAAPLAGCYATARNDVTASAPTDYRQRHPIVLKEKDHTVELLIGDRRGDLTMDQRADVAAFAETWRREASGGIVIEVPTGTRNASAAGGAARQARAILAAAGVPPRGIVVRSHVGHPAKLATVRLTYPRMGAEAGPCGMWPSDIGPTSAAYFQNASYWNLGCASQRNMAAMVANPADLVQPRGEGAVYQMRRTYMVEQYRRGEQTSSKAPPDDAAKISDVGK